MSKEIVEVAVGGGVTRIVEAQRFGNLAVYRAAAGEGAWAVLHPNSNRLVALRERKRDAVAIAKELGSLPIFEHGNVNRVERGWYALWPVISRVLEAHRKPNEPAY